VKGKHHDIANGARGSCRRVLLGHTGSDPQNAGRHFHQIHDPTTRNRQGNDAGTSYRSAIFYVTEEQKRIAEDTIADVEASGLWPGKVVTELAPAGRFWEAEPEHQDYLERYPDGYTCHFVRPSWKLAHRGQAKAS
jgi:peptide-methionine (S)-S-oxide reductase